MSRRWLLSLLCLSAAAVFVQLSSANTALHVNESATRFLIQDQTIVLLEVSNPAAQAVPVGVKLELLDPKDFVRAQALRKLALRPGVNKLSIPLAYTAASGPNEDSLLPWYRLRYRIVPASEIEAPPKAATGIISLSEIDTPDIFALEVSASRTIHPGSRLYAHVRALHPITRKPVKDVNVNVTLELDSGKPERDRNGSGSTDAEGYALVHLDIPSRINDDEGELRVVARHNGYTRETSRDIDINDTSRIMVTTDKTIYQPGQPLHVRTLVFDSAKRAAANVETTFKITDSEGTNVFQTSVQTSRFGVATAAWLIPENTRLGNYFIEVQVEDGGYGNAEGYQRVRISRYDLPNFAVNVKTDRSYYLPRQNADVEVRADYLFGQPVKRGQVRVVHEEERDWNFPEQKWDIKSAENYEGETDETGRFVAHVNLSKAHAKLAAEDYLRFTDLRFAAYFTDPTTNRTEQKRFDLRVTKEAIHIYAAEGRERQTRGFPLQFYLATSYADGTPASCEVAINAALEKDRRSEKYGPLLRGVRTNKFGIAKIVGLKMPDVTGWADPTVHFVARDASGAKGRHTESFYWSDVPVIRVETDKALYGPGEKIDVRISASEPEMQLIVNLAREQNIIESRSLTLHNGTAAFSIPYRPIFKDEIAISAYAKPGKSRYYTDYLSGSRTVLFPRDRDLKLDVRFDRAEYKPGADATVDFRVTSPAGGPADSALGVVIFDRAVEERARTDQEFGGDFGFYGSFSQWCGYDDQVGGITRKSLQRLDLTKPLAPEMDLVAELLLSSRWTPPQFFDADEFETQAQKVFEELTTLQLKQVRDLLDTQYKNHASYPASVEALHRSLFEFGADFDQLKDPWGTPYREEFSVEQDDKVLSLISAGPDKAFDTKDDFLALRIARPYFRFTGEAISRAVERYHQRTGNFIRDGASLKSELNSEGIDFDSLRDPWGEPYVLNFTVRKDLLSVIVRSSGPDKRLEDAASTSDDFTLWLASIDYLRETRALMQKALSEYFAERNTLPANDEQLEHAFAKAGVEPASLIDPWGHRYYTTYKSESKYADRAVMQTVSTYGQPATERLKISPVTQQISSIFLRSSGEDGRVGTADDFDAAYFSQLTGETSVNGATPDNSRKEVFFSGAKGAISGTIVDVAGAVVPGAKLTATLQGSTREFTGETDDEGKFMLRNLPVGYYTVRCETAGFKIAIVAEVPVSSSNITTINFTLEAGSITEVVQVSAGAPGVLDSTSSQTVNVTEGRMKVSIGHPIQLATPRLREYFPETLVWQPSLETNKQGYAQLKFKLADNITTWKMSVIGSTENGELGVAETEFKAFQPFFVEHDPPRVLTEGDQISLPIVLRNYLEREQSVDVELKPESWFTLQSAAKQRAAVPAGESLRQTFDLKTVASIKDGKQRVTARGSEASDAIEKPVTVHPDGEEQTQTVSDLLTDSLNLNLIVPSSVIAGSTQAELKIYPSLLDHVVESVEGILKRPYGCGEQTISSTYPSVLILRHDKRTNSTSRISKKAQRYLELGYQRLLNYRSSDGGFTYWGRGDSDLALTAYALRFLHEARDFVQIEDSVINGAREWLIKHQAADGSWAGYDPNNTALVTAFVTRVLAMTQSVPGISARQSPGHLGLERGLLYLERRVDSIDEPYLMASFALAAIDANDRQRATRAVTRLRALAHSEKGASYWALETNTPFYGWGKAGRVETTALVVQALQRFEKSSTETSNDPLVRAGLLFLLREKDRYGVWYSTQATINVLDTMMALLATDSRAPKTNNPVEVVVNGHRVMALELTDTQNESVISADISRFLQRENNVIQLRRAPGSPFVSVQLVANYYVPWETGVTQKVKVTNGESTLLRLQTTFDKQTAKINEEISCRVKAERVGFHGYGMMLAEIGLPPGADVDRASLESAIKNSNWAINQYDVLPDRVVVYLWPRAGGVDFNFKFRPRLALIAKTSPSVVYDYYNPEARALVAPATFVVK